MKEGWWEREGGEESSFLSSLPAFCPPDLNFSNFRTALALHCTVLYMILLATLILPTSPLCNPPPILSPSLPPFSPPLPFPSLPFPSLSPPLVGIESQWIRGYEEAMMALHTQTYPLNLVFRRGLLHNLAATVQGSLVRPVSVCVYKREREGESVCVCKRERGRGRECVRLQERERERERVCLCEV
jgi:hypothetical protein